MFFALAALVLAFTGCSQEDEAIQTNEQKAVKVVVNMDKPGFGTDARAPRQGWEDGDQVIGTIGSPGIGILLTYNSGSWTTKFLKVSGAKYVEASSADLDEMLVDETGDVMAAYFSSKIIENDLEFKAPPTAAKPTMVITTNASCGFDKFGECVMTCENGTCEVEKTASGYVLTLNITMIPQVAQYTIRNLNVTGGWNISIEGPVNGYAGGIITPDGIDLTLIEDVLYGYLHQNGNDISIFAAPWQSNADIPDFIRSLPGYEITSEESYKEPYVFTVHDEDTYWFVREFDYKEVAIGGAVIMDGPYTDGAASKWGVE